MNKLPQSSPRRTDLAISLSVMTSPPRKGINWRLQCQHPWVSTLNDIAVLLPQLA